MEKKEAYRNKLEAQMREWSAKIDLLKARADQAEAEAKIEYNKRIEDLRQKKEALKAKLDDLRNASDAASCQLLAACCILYSVLWPLASHLVSPIRAKAISRKSSGLRSGFSITADFGMRINPRVSSVPGPP